jgi:Putative zinc-finger
MGWFQKNSDTAEHGYVEDRLSAYLDGELSLQEQMAVDHHLARCQDCRCNLKTMRQTVQWTRELPAVPVPRVFTISAPAQAIRAPRPRRTVVPLLQGATALVALLLVFVVAGDVMFTGFLRAPVPQFAAPMEQPAAKMEATLVVEVTKLVEMVVETAAVEAETTEVVKEVGVEVTVEVEAPPPSAAERAAEMPTAAAAQPPSLKEAPATEAASALDQSIATTQTAAPAAMGGLEATAQAAIGGGPPATEAAEPSSTVAPAVATTRAYITGAAEAIATLLPTPSPTVSLEVALPVIPAVEATPAMAATATPQAFPTEAPALAEEAATVERPTEPPLPLATAEPAAGIALAATSAPLPTEAPAAAVEPAPDMLPKVAPTALAPTAMPTAVAAVGEEGQLLGTEPGERAPGTLQEQPVGWLRAAEMALGAAFILLATATIVAMMRRRAR